MNVKKQKLTKVKLSKILNYDPTKFTLDLALSFYTRLLLFVKVNGSLIYCSTKTIGLDPRVVGHISYDIHKYYFIFIKVVLASTFNVLYILTCFYLY